MSRTNKSKFTDEQTSKFLSRGLRNVKTRKERELLAHHLLAISFLNYHFSASAFGDTIVSSLRNLLRDQFNAGVASVRKAKKRVK